jgi:hypothetical protein
MTCQLEICIVPGIDHPVTAFKMDKALREQSPGNNPAKNIS